jgi:hypothetical protein
MLHFFQKELLLTQQDLKFTLRCAALSYILDGKKNGRMQPHQSPHTMM